MLGCSKFAIVPDLRENGSCFVLRIQLASWRQKHRQRRNQREKELGASRGA